MRLRDVMSVQPLTVGPDASPEVLRRMMADGRVHHLPLVDGDRLVGMWLGSDAGPVVLLGPERFEEAPAETDALDALKLLLEGKEAVVATEGDRPVGIITRADALRIVQEGLDAEARRRRVAPLVVRLVGPAGAGKTTLLLKTIAALRDCEAGIIEANPAPAHQRLPDRIGGATVEYAPDAHWRKGLREAVARLGGAEIVFVEDRDQPPRVGTGLGEDVQVLVVPAADAGRIDDLSVREAQAIVLTKPEEAPSLDEQGIRRRMAELNPSACVFVVGAAEPDDGLAAWHGWIVDRLRLHHG